VDYGERHIIEFAPRCAAGAGSVLRHHRQIHITAASVTEQFTAGSERRTLRPPHRGRMQPPQLVRHCYPVLACRRWLAFHPLLHDQSAYLSAAIHRRHYGGNDETEQRQLFQQIQLPFQGRARALARPSYQTPAMRISDLHDLIAVAPTQAPHDA